MRTESREIIKDIQLQQDSNNSIFLIETKDNTCRTKFDTLAVKKEFGLFACV